nr:MAG TPA: hypothetical protein [Caudoviricetes sp.]
MIYTDSFRLCNGTSVFHNSIEFDGIENRFS